MRSQDAIFVPAGEGHRQNILGMTHITKVSPQEDDAGFLAFELHIPPRAGPPMHRHEQDSECFYVLEGEITFSTPEGEIVGRPGSFCFLPAGGSHAFCNKGDHDAKALIISSPGRSAYTFFNELDRRVQGPVDKELLSEIAANNGMSMCA